MKQYGRWAAASAPWILLIAGERALGIAWFDLVIFSLLTIVAEFVAVPAAERSEVSIGLLIDWAVYLVAGADVAVWNAFFSRLAAWQIRSRSLDEFPLRRALLQSGARAVALWVGITTEQALVAMSFAAPRSWQASVASGLIYGLTYAALRALGRAWAWKSSPIKQLARQITFLPAFSTALVAAGWYMADALAGLGRAGWPVLLLLVVFFALAVTTTRSYINSQAMHWATLRALVAAMEARRPDHRGHARRTADYAGDIACRLCLSDSQIRRAIIAAEVHDIGMMAIDDEYLLASGTLDEETREQLRLHAHLGGDLVDVMPFLAGAGPIVRHHHERWDGTGYPDRLADTEIPVESRVVALAEAIDAMLTRLDHRDRTLTPAEVEAELRAGAGSQFDPRMVPAAVALVRDLGRQPSHVAHGAAAVDPRG